MGKTALDSQNNKNSDMDSLIEETSNPDPRPQPDNTTNVYLWLIVCSAMMFTLPFAAFFLVRNWLYESYHIDGFENTCWATLAAVVTVNLIICIYAYIAYLEDKKENPEEYERRSKKKN